MKKQDSQMAKSNKRRKVLLTNPLSPNVEQQFQSFCQPYRHCQIKQLCIPERMQLIHEEAKSNLASNFKETDLFKLFQTGDLACIDELKPELANKMPQLIALRDALYSPEFRQIVENVTGCENLTDRVDCAMNAYTSGCHLLCHDDVIGTRCVSYIIYLSDPDDSWTAAHGGCLELYPLDTATQIDRGLENGGLQGIPVVCPTVNIVPSFNSMVMFVVQPGRSYHAVQEVFTDEMPRLSIQGWYHAPTPPKGADKASLSQILTKGDSLTPFTPMTPAASSTSASSASQPADTSDTLTAEDVATLSQWISATYLKEDSMNQIHKRFCKNSSIQLHDFLKKGIAKQIVKAAKRADARDELGKGRVPKNYELGVEDATAGDDTPGWHFVGPPHKRRYLSYTTGSALAEEGAEQEAGAIMDCVRQQLMRSPAFVRYITRLTSLQPIGFKDHVRRFRPGLDYTVAHYGEMTVVPRLDATLCFVDTSDQGEDGDLDGQELWSGGDVGGFECYIAADMRPDQAEAAEVYRIERPTDKAGAASESDKGQSKNHKKEEEVDTSAEDSLLSVSAGSNVFSLVMRDENVMRFIKYVSIQAPGSRWDISTEYELDMTGSDSSSDDDSEDDEGDQDDEEGEGESEEGDPYASCNEDDSEEDEEGDEQGAGDDTEGNPEAEDEASNQDNQSFHNSDEEDDDSADN